MGAIFDSFSCKVKREELAAEFNKYVNVCFYEYGHSGYTGTMAECEGMQITSQEFNSEDEAEEWLMDNTEKWGPALVVKINPENNQSYWLFGAWCSS